MPKLCCTCSKRWASTSDWIRLVEELRDATSKKNLVAFFYELMRDHLPIGVVEQLVRNCEMDPENPVIFTNGFLARYAQELAERLTSPEGTVEDGNDTGPSKRGSVEDQG